MKSLKSMITNATYKWDSYFQSTKDEKIKIQYFLGQECLDQEQFLQIQNSLIWLSYRDGIKMGTRIISDQGWGCLVRVGQMILANCLMRITEYQAKHMQEVRELIIEMFNENNEDAPFRIQKIIKRAEMDDIKIKLGEWYTGPKLMSILEELNDHQNVNLAFPPLKILNFYEQCIYEQHIENIKAPIMIVVHAMVSMKNEGINQIKQYLQIPQFCGAVVGKSGKAYFLLGYNTTEQGQENALYVDPHFVQQCGKNNYAGEVRWIPMKKLSGSIGLTFIIQNKQDYFKFKQQILNIVNPIFSIIE